MKGNSFGSASSPPTINGFAAFRRHPKLFRAGGSAKTQSSERNDVSSGQFYSIKNNLPNKHCTQMAPTTATINFAIFLRRNAM